MMDETEEACRDEDAAAEELPAPATALSPLSPLSPPLPAPPDTFGYPVVTSPDPDPPPRSECSPDNNTVSRRSVEGSSSVASSRIRHLPEPGQTMVPEREPLTFDVERLSTEECMAMEGLLQLLDNQLWHWKNFPINLPDPIIQAKADTLGPGAGARSLKVNDLFVVPDFDELKAVAMGPSGEIRRLSEDQLDALRDTGEFEVPSQKFPGQRHKWRVSRLLIKGSANTKKAFYKELSKALYLIGN